MNLLAVTENKCLFFHFAEETSFVRENWHDGKYLKMQISVKKNQLKSVIGESRSIRINKLKKRISSYKLSARINNFIWGEQKSQRDVMTTS